MKVMNIGGDMSSEISTDELAANTARLLGADNKPGVVDYLKSVFEKVASGSIDEAQPYAKLSEARADPLAAARARGRRFAAEDYRNPDNLALLDARDYAGRNERAINEQRQRGELYALLPPGKERGFRYPKWQFDADPVRLAAALEPFASAKANSWVIHSFMRSQRQELGGLAPCAVILDPNAELGPIVDLAKQEMSGEQGAL
jgi:hypothetical protein